MATANNFAKSLVKKYLFNEDVYQTDVAFSTNGDKMFVNGVDLNKATTIYEYNAAQAYKSLNAQIVTGNDISGFTFDLSSTTGQDVSGIFGGAQTLFDFKQGVSDMYQFVLDLSNSAAGGTPSPITFSVPITDASAVRMVNLSNEAIQSGSHVNNANHSTPYKAGVLYFTHNISFGASSAGPDSSGGSASDNPAATGNDLSNNLVHEVTRAKNMYNEIDDKYDQIIQQFERIFFKDDGMKMYALYRSKNKRFMMEPKPRPYVLQTFDLTSAFSLKNINSNLDPTSLTNHTVICDRKILFSNPVAGSLADLGPITYAGTAGLFSKISGSTDVPREVIGFHISKDGKKIFFLSRRGRYGSQDSEVTSSNTYFGEVSCFKLASDWNVTSAATYVSSALVYGKESSSTSMDDLGVHPIDINFNYDGTKLHILGSEGKQEYVYTYQLDSAYTLPSSLEYGSRILVKDSLLSFSSANNSDGVLKNVHGSGVESRFANEFKSNSVTIGNSFTFKNRSLLSNGLQNIITSKKVTNVFEFEKQKTRAKPNNYYNYDPTKSKIVLKGGVEVYISNLKVNESKFEVSGMEFTFIGLVTKELNGLTYYAIVVNPSGVIPLEVTLVGGDSHDTIQSQPYMGDANAQGQIEDQTGLAFNDVINNGGNV